MANVVEGDIEIPQPTLGKMSIQLSNAGVREWVQSRRDSIQPWQKFLNFNKFGKPKDGKELMKRVAHNLSLYQSNYLFVFIGLAIYCLLTTPLLVVAIGILFAAWYIVHSKFGGKKIKVMGHELTMAQQYGLLSTLSLPLFFLAGGTSAIFWVLGASFSFIMLHASLLSIDVDEDSEELLMESVLTIDDAPE
ncbi:prenylated Rab acceptor protein 1-like [Anneissia japonica]|uniref:prenylated Rab acceptor protein 1-like n=1 Tax=Anneissia japonica TaxID=1529436 RepID=UPI001425BA3E|nr:prenylated Rab acceptor protein 1-like [Anneissia japonica]